MTPCDLSYIPDRLHYTNGKRIIDEFFVNDILYRRVTQKMLENPFNNITLSDLSHNLGTNNGNQISKLKDVLYSINKEEEESVYTQPVITLRIISVNEQNEYNKVFENPKNSDIKIRIKLTHKPVACMYPHVVFQFFMTTQTEKEVTFDNYSHTLGHRRNKQLRTIVRHELASMITKRVISQDNIN